MKKILLPIFLLLSSYAWAAPAFVQTTAQAYKTPFNANPPTIVQSFSSTPTVNDLIVVAYYEISATQANTQSATCADNQGNSYTGISYTDTNNIHLQYSTIYIFWAIASTSSGTFTVTCTAPNGSYTTDVAAEYLTEYSGIRTSSPYLSLTNSASGSGTTISPGAITSGTANTLYFSHGYNNTSGTVTANNSFNLRAGSSGYEFIEDYVGTGSQTGSFTGASNNNAAIVAAFAPTGVASAGPTTINNATIRNATIN